MGWSWPQPFETVDHTADTGVRVRGKSVEEALARLVLGFSQLLTGGPAPTACQSLDIEVPTDDDRVLVAIDTLRAMHSLFCHRRLIAREVCDVSWAKATVRLRIVVGSHDPDLHAEGCDIKAVTYHAARFDEEGDLFVAQVLLDV